MELECVWWRWPAHSGARELFILLYRLLDKWIAAWGNVAKANCANSNVILGLVLRVDGSV